MGRKPIEITSDNWRVFAACRGLDTNLFITDKGASHYEVADAKAVCKSCRVTAHCLEYALAQSEEMIGVWGGTSGRDRRRMRSATNSRVG